MHASLYANNRDNRYALLDYNKIASRDGYFLVPGKASLLSQTFNRDLLVSIENEGGASQFIKLKLRAKPRKEDEAWSDWMTATERADLSPVPESERIAVRYRVERNCSTAMLAVAPTGIWPFDHEVLRRRRGEACHGRFRGRHCDIPDYASYLLASSWRKTNCKIPPCR